MVAYSFQKRFADDVAHLRKRQTIRAHRKRHARPGEPIQLFTGMRTKHCRKLVSPDPICLSVEPIDLLIVGPDMGIDVRLPEGSKDDWFRAGDKFAAADGFESEGDMVEFWIEHHPGRMEFSGVLIKWEVPQ
ncbi:MAG: hypothetical protein AAGH60_15580 [Pseudomonadota bacterium]